MNLKDLTKYILIVLAVVLVIYDIIAVLYGGKDATISLVIYNAAKSYPIIPLGFGILMGHFFFPAQS